MKELPYDIDYSFHEEASLYEAWLKEKSALQIQEIATLFQWDISDGKIDNSEDGFNGYLVALFRQDIAQGWSISEEIDPFKLLPIEIQSWYSGLYHYNIKLLLDEYSSDNRYPDLELADYVREIYDDPERRNAWSIAIPMTSNAESLFAWHQVEWLLEDDGDFESAKAYFDHCQAWRQKTFEEFKKVLIENLQENEIFELEFIDEYEDYLGDENAFLGEIEFKELYDFLQNEYNGWPTQITEPDRSRIVYVDTSRPFIATWDLRDFKALLEKGIEMGSQYFFLIRVVGVCFYTRSLDFGRTGDEDFQDFTIHADGLNEDDIDDFKAESPELYAKSKLLYPGDLCECFLLHPEMVDDCDLMLDKGFDKIRMTVNSLTLDLSPFSEAERERFHAGSIFVHKRSIRMGGGDCPISNLDCEINLDYIISTNNDKKPVSCWSNDEVPLHLNRHNVRNYLN